MIVHIGDRVKIVDMGRIYSTYPDFLDYYSDFSGTTLYERVRRQYTFGRLPTQAETRNVFTVMFVREHGSESGRKLAVINDGAVTYIINVEGLTLVSSDLPFTEGDRVFIRDSSYVYSEWQKLIKHMSTVIPDGAEVYQKWSNCRNPDAEEIDVT